jgi:Skp family chaperone for outer membrane proteins
MHRRSFAPMLVLVLLTGATVVAQNGPTPPGPQGGDAAKKRGLKIGVVDIGVLFRDYKRKETLENEVNQRREKIKKELEDDGEALRRMRQNFDKCGFVPNSEQWLALRDEIRQASNVLELKQERLQGILKRQVEELTLQILTELQHTIRAYGTRYQYDMILKSDASEQQAQGELGAHFQERIFRAQISDLLFHSEAVDITEAVKQLLNDPATLRAMEELEKKNKAERAAAQQKALAEARGQGTGTTTEAGAPKKN